MFSVLNANLTFAICNGRLINASSCTIVDILDWKTTIRRERKENMNNCNNKNPPERNIKFDYYFWNGNWNSYSEIIIEHQIIIYCVPWLFRPFRRSTIIQFYWTIDWVFCLGKIWFWRSAQKFTIFFFFFHGVATKNMSAKFVIRFHYFE